MWLKSFYDLLFFASYGEYYIYSPLVDFRFTVSSKRCFSLIYHVHSWHISQISLNSTDLNCTFANEEIPPRGKSMNGALVTFIHHQCQLMVNILSVVSMVFSLTKWKSSHMWKLFLLNSLRPERNGHNLKKKTKTWSSIGWQPNHQRIKSGEKSFFNFYGFQRENIVVIQEPLQGAIFCFYFLGNWHQDSIDHGSTLFQIMDWGLLSNKPIPVWMTNQIILG